mgnify:CR=1 FL=1
MSSARKRSALNRCQAELERTEARLSLVQHQYAVLQALAESLASICDDRQAKIDALMLEYCPEKISKDQIEAYAAAQRAAAFDSFPEDYEVG